MSRLMTLLLCLFVASFLRAQQSNEFLSTKSITLESSILDEEREIIIYSPDNGKSRNPTLYLLDGHENLLLAVGIISNLVRADAIPPVNLVGINNYDYDRTHDLTPSQVVEEAQEQFGGGDDFLKFIEKELFPEVDKHLPADSYRVLIGHSLGALFATHVLRTRGELFDAYVAVSPSLWFDKEYEARELSRMPVNGTRSSRAYFSLANETDSKNGFELLEKSLGKYEGLYRFDEFPHADHVTSLVPALFNGLQFVFGSWAGWDAYYEDQNFEAIKERVELLSVEFKMEVRPRVVPMASYARSFTGQKEFERAIEILTWLEGFYPEHIMVLNYLGEAWQKKGDFQKAKPIYLKSLEIAKSKGSPMVRWINQRLEEMR